MAVGIKEISKAQKSIENFGKDLYEQVTGETKDLTKKVEKAFFGNEQEEAIKGYITAVNNAVGKLFENMQYWTGALQKVYDEVYAQTNKTIASEVSNASSSVSSSVGGN